MKKDHTDTDEDSRGKRTPKEDDEEAKAATEYHLNQTFQLTMSEAHIQQYGTSPAFFVFANGVSSPIRRYRELSLSRVFPRDTIVVHVDKGRVSKLTNGANTCSRCKHTLSEKRGQVLHHLVGCDENTKPDHPLLGQAGGFGLAERSNCFVHEDVCARMVQGFCDYRLHIRWVGNDRRGTELSARGTTIRNDRKSGREL